MPAESSAKLLVKLHAREGIECDAHESLILEYWPNDLLDPHEDEPHLRKIEIKLDMIEAEPLDDDEINGAESTDSGSKTGLKIALVLFLLLMIVGIILLVSGYLKKKFRSAFRVGGQAGTDEEAQSLVDDESLFANSGEDSKRGPADEEDEEELAVED